ncbi:PhyH-domain-containing protein [Tilletiaria anomala UBC 951]|uniref:PhyH-domain-containing protein n=1 Tax=Tilletiaria anomala (strain ATCC 24038 / CBS 436.72 / UBC 951) TaxID=1037660 RepID=A0A066W1J9_TILAU|nr:PhyH-domain-containing protein [Tilletiaria anomala UBC 951]KDN44934.1 PhyH-domain-containing protein [Tilletiaria anomala UBC 951]
MTHEPKPTTLPSSVTAPVAALSSSNDYDGTLTPAQVERFHREGYLVLPNFFDAAPILEHAKQVINGFDPQRHPMTQFSTGEEDDQQMHDRTQSKKHVGDAYFLESGDAMRYFLEEGAVGKDGKLTCEPSRAVNKCGHALHALDPTFAKFSFDRKIQNVARSLNVHKDPRVLQSMIICKQPSIGGAVPSHNDSTFLYTDPPSAVGFWFALEDCTSANGCLSFMPGSHRWPSSTSPAASGAPRPRDDPAYLSKLDLGPARGINKRFVRNDPSDTTQGTSFTALGDGESEEAKWDDEAARMEECKAGALVLIHGSVLHKSEKNLSPKSRYIYTFHMIEGQDKYDDKNWLQPTPKLPFTPLLNPPEAIKQLIEA